jgi:hypothetical protein
MNLKLSSNRWFPGHAWSTANDAANSASVKPTAMTPGPSEPLPVDNR